MWSSLAWMLAVPGEAAAAACCIGSTSTVPTRLGECERASVGLGLKAQQLVGVWDRAGSSAPSSLSETTFTMGLAGALRIDRRLQLALQAPFLANHKQAGPSDAWGGGFGDVTVGALWDPVEETVDPDALSLPVPVVGLGVRAPTGRSWEQSDSALLEDVTGSGHPALTASLQFERTMDRVPWSLSAQGEVAAAHGGEASSVMRYDFAVGRYFGTGWSALAMAGHQRARATLSDASTASSSTEVGLRVVRGQQRFWRAWAGASLGLPIKGLGHSTGRYNNLAAGFVRVW